MEFIGYLLARRGIGELNRGYFFSFWKPNLSSSDVLHELEGNDILIMMGHEIFVADHGFIVRLLIVNRLVQLLSAKHR